MLCLTSPRYLYLSVGLMVMTFSFTSSGSSFFLFLGFWIPKNRRRRGHCKDVTPETSRTNGTTLILYKNA